VLYRFDSERFSLYGSNSPDIDCYVPGYCGFFGFFRSQMSSAMRLRQKMDELRNFWGTISAARFAELGVQRQINLKNHANSNTQISELIESNGGYVDSPMQGRSVENFAI